MTEGRGNGGELAVRREQDIAAAAGFDNNSSMRQVEDQVGAVSAIAREESELKAAIIVAKKFPRNEHAAYTKLLKSCERPSFAEEATYCFPRGGENVEGPSVDMAREAKRVWGNMRSGVRIVSKDEDWIHIKGYALDLETNNYVESEAKFRRLIFRKKGGWQKPDERDERELTNRIGAICERNAILQILPPDAIDDAERTAKETQRKAAAGELKQDRQAAIRRLVKAFFEISVTAEQLEAFLAHPLDLTDEQELVKLRGIWKSIQDGNSKRSDYFTVPGNPATGNTGAVDLDAILPSDAPPRPRPGTPPAAPAPAPSPAPAPAPAETSTPAADAGGAPSAEEQEAIRRREELQSKAFFCTKCNDFGSDTKAEFDKHEKDKHSAPAKPASAAPKKEGGGSGSLFK